MLGASRSWPPDAGRFPGLYALKTMLNQMATSPVTLYSRLLSAFNLHALDVFILSDPTVLYQEFFFTTNVDRHAHMITLHPQTGSQAPRMQAHRHIHTHRHLVLLVPIIIYSYAVTITDWMVI